MLILSTTIISTFSRQCMLIFFLSQTSFRPAVGQYAENQRITAVRKVFQRGVSTPMLNIETLWSDYCAYEKGINSTLAEKLIGERNKEYQIAKKVTKQLETVTRGINRQAVSVPSRGTTQELKQVCLLFGYLECFL